jgi:S1-C subfamily serine protease
LRLLGQPTGAVVRSVAPDSGAERAGLRGFAMTRDGRLILGDVIKKIDDQPVATSDDLLTILEKHKPGDTVTVTYLRDDELRTARVQLQRPKR